MKRSDRYWRVLNFLKFLIIGEPVILISRLFLRMRA